jgi:porphobilinogen synthase
MRRLRKTEALRALVRENNVTMNDLIYPMFIEEDADDYRPIKSMPGINRVPETKLAAEMKTIAAEGVRAVMMFGVSHHKDDIGGDSLKTDGLLARMIKRAKDAAPELVVISDNCFCDYTSHGHCGVVDHGHVHNDHTLKNLAHQAVVAASAGADMVAPSAMMDGQIAAMRTALDQAGYGDTPIMSYSSKMASGFYGPFREALEVELKGDRKAYQMDPANGREAIRESAIDEAEGADILMVKPGLAYLDVLAAIRARTTLPLAMYQVSGEYAMIKFAAAAGAIDEKRIVRETLTSMKRAGADLILSYFARDLAREGI